MEFLSETVVESSDHTEFIPTVDVNTQKQNTWSSIVTKNIPSKEPASSETAKVTFNEDGSATIQPPKNFLASVRKNWSTSIIGHFIGGSFEFRFVREQAFKLWKNHGLSRVFYSSKGNFTFKLNSEIEKQKILGLNSVVMGGRTLYLMPWMEANKFKKNVIETVPCWIKLKDVPHSYWSREGLTHIAKAIGSPLKFDEITARFEPTKYASVQVPVQDEHGTEELVKVSIIYPQLPYSYTHCKAFGHSFARCAYNPNVVKPNPHQRPGGAAQGASKVARKNQPPHNTDSIHSNVLVQAQQDGLNNATAADKANEDVNPVVLGEFLGCDVVLDADQTLEDVQ
ncbi:uncharacterized protein LOC141679484 [Apium graveolens]|uniref:uncharacterized protein LOC141679484 n=1 Tax=Apium graveolens TaxID=4045 RepID=UPI003D79D91F